jgi:hypothetical protein
MSSQECELSCIRVLEVSKKYFPKIHWASSIHEYAFTHKIKIEQCNTVSTVLKGISQIVETGWIDTSKTQGKVMTCCWYVTHNNIMLYWVHLVMIGTRTHNYHTFTTTTSLVTIGRAFTHKIKIEQCNTVSTVLKGISQIVETGWIDTSKTRMHDSSHSWLDIYTLQRVAELR